ncbi:MAG: SMP-30/gluconolactonase/LRE family protein [Lachnospiraceae bacterium]|nr:SMP-30/gluconolactonase/LRE family protein [Lachnospiraceae bacterium]
MKTYNAEVFDSNRYKLAEGPYYDERFDRLSWVDILEGKLYTKSHSIKTTTNMDQMLGAAVPMENSEGFVCAAQDGLYMVNGSYKRQIVDLSEEFKAYRRANDAKADPSGRLWFGSIVWDDKHEQGGSLYMYDGKTVKCMQKETGLANGMAWSGDKKRFYFSDSAKHKVFVYDYDDATGDITNMRQLCHISVGVPDGMCIDADDNIWLAVWGGRRVEHRDGISGELLGVICVDAEQVSSCAFCGKNYDELIITSAGNGVSGQFDGCLFKCRVDAVGLAPHLARI